MNERLAAGLAFLVAGGVLAAFALAMTLRVHGIRRSAVKTTGTVVETRTQATRKRRLESIRREGEPRQELRGGRVDKIDSPRTRWVQVEYRDADGASRQASRLVYGRYAQGQQVRLLLPADDPSSVQIDSPLELYRRAAVAGIMGLVFLVIGALILGNVVPLAGG